MEVLRSIPLCSYSKLLLQDKNLQELSVKSLDFSSSPFHERLAALQSAAFKRDGAMAGRFALNDTSRFMRARARVLAARYADSTVLIEIFDQCGHWDRFHLLHHLRQRRRVDVIDSALELLRLRNCATDFLNCMPFGSKAYVAQVYPLYHGWLTNRNYQQLAKTHPLIALKGVQLLVEASQSVDSCVMNHVEVIFRHCGHTNATECATLLSMICEKCPRNRWPLNQASLCISATVFFEWLLVHPKACETVQLRKKSLLRNSRQPNFAQKIAAAPDLIKVEAWSLINSKTIREIWDALDDRDIDFSESFLAKLPRSIRSEPARRMIEKYSKAALASEQEKAGAFSTLLPFYEAIAYMKADQKVSRQTTGHDLGRLMARWPEHMEQGWPILCHRIQKAIRQRQGPFDNPWEAFTHIPIHLVTHEMIIKLQNIICLDKEKDRHNWRRYQAISAISPWLFMDYPEFAACWEPACYPEWVVKKSDRRFREPDEEFNNRKHFRLTKEAFAQAILGHLPLIVESDPSNRNVFLLVKRLTPFGEQLSDLLTTMLTNVDWTSSDPCTLEYTVVPCLRLCGVKFLSSIVERTSTDLRLLKVDAVSELVPTLANELLDRYLSCKGILDSNMHPGEGLVFVTHLSRNMNYRHWTPDQMDKYCEQLVAYIFCVEKTKTNAARSRARERKAAQDPGQGVGEDSEDQCDADEQAEGTNSEADIAEKPQRKVSGERSELNLPAEGVDPFNGLITKDNIDMVASNATQLLKSLTKVFMWNPNTLKEYVDRQIEGTEEYFQQEIIGAFGKADDIRGMQLLLEYLNTEHARIAMYAIRPAIKMARKEEILELAKSVGWKGVSVAKEIVRLMGVTRMTEARDELIALFHQKEPKPAHRDVRVAIIRAMWEFLADSTTWDFLDSTFDDPDHRVVRKVCWTSSAGVSSEALKRLVDYVGRTIERNDPKLTVGVMQRLSQRPIPDMSGRLWKVIVERVNDPDDSIRSHCRVALRPALERLDDNVRQKAIDELLAVGSRSTKDFEDLCEFIEGWRWVKGEIVDQLINRCLKYIRHIPFAEFSAGHLLVAGSDPSVVLSYLTDLQAREPIVYTHVVCTTLWQNADETMLRKLSSSLNQRMVEGVASEDDAMLAFQVFKGCFNHPGEWMTEPNKVLEGWRNSCQFPVIQGMATQLAEKEKETSPSHMGFRGPQHFRRRIATGEPEPHYLQQQRERGRKRALRQAIAQGCIRVL